MTSPNRFPVARRLALPLMACGALALAAGAHEDDPKVLDREPMYTGPGLRTHVGVGGSTIAMSTQPSFPHDNVELLSWMTLTETGGSEGLDCWGYTSPSGREYAILTTDNRTAWIEITDPRNPSFIISKSGPISGWRDVKVYNDHAYVVSEDGPGVQIFDMSAIDSGSVVKVNEIGGSSSPSHNVVIDTDSGYLYRVGGAANGCYIYDLDANPTNPPFVGSWSTKYIHDMQVVTYTSGPLAGKEIGYACSGYNGGWSSTGLTILDLTNKSNVQIIDEVFWSNAAYSHQAWLTPDRQYLYLNDELDEQTFGVDTVTFVMNVADPYNAFLVGSFDNNKSATGHNLYVKGDLLYEANYHSGLRVFDTSTPTAPVEIGYFDTYEKDNKDGFNGMWSNFPFFNSGVVIGSDREKGLFVLWPEDSLLEWSWPNGEPTELSSYGDSFTVELVELNPGELVGGTPELLYDTGSGYQSVPLGNLGGGLYSVDFPSLPCGTSVQWYLSAESQNGVTWHYPELGSARPMTMEAAENAHLILYDDMEAPGAWTASGVAAGLWEHGVPTPSNAVPGEDHSIAGVNCWFTDDANNVNNGSTTLTSPVYDLSSYGNPVISYYLWYSNHQGANAGEDPFTVELTDDGVNWVTAVVSGPSGIETQGDWLRYELRLTDHVSATSTVQIRFIAEDTGSSAKVEATLDDLRIHDLGCGAVNYCAAGTSASGCAATLSATGVPSATAPNGFSISASGVEGGKDALFFFGTNGRQSNPWGNGSSLQCVTPPVSRAGLLNGIGTSGACDGGFTQDLNALWCPGCSSPAKNPGAGSQVQAQLWYRDPMNTSNQTTSLSDALEFTLAP